MREPRPNRVEEELRLVTASLKLESEPRAAALEEAIKQRDSLSARISALEESLRSSAAESEPLREQRREAETQLASARAELETVKRNCEAHEVKLREIGEAFATSERERLALALKVADDTSSKELAAAREKVAQLQTQVVDAQNTLLTIRGERDKVRQTLAERDQRLEQESQALAAANSDLERAKAGSDRCYRGSREGAGAGYRNQRPGRRACKRAPTLSPNASKPGKLNLPTSGKRLPMLARTRIAP
jgi:chromosome segregation ATPase